MADNNEILKRIRILTDASNLDERYGVWDSIADANANIPIGVRKPGLTLGIYSDINTVEEYWYNEGISDSDLVLKADLTTTESVTDSGALMDSEITNLQEVKDFDSSDYATKEQGELADSSVQNVGDETIGGVKTFSSSPIIPAPTTDLQAATKKYVDDNGAISVDSVANVATDTILGRISAGSGESEELTPTQVRGLINVEANADITDTENVRSSGALMDDEVANLGQVKAFDSSDYANAVETTNALNDRVKSVTVSEPNGSDKVVNIVSLTQAEYDAGTPVADTFYIIT